MPTEADLLAAIDADPDADRPRLAHAAWLAKRDPDRARFIRAQVRIANAPPDEAAERDTAEAKRILAANRTRWLAGRPTPRGAEWGFVRGHPEEIIFTSRVLFEKSWPTLLVPGVRRVRFNDVAGLSRIAECPGLARVRELVISQLHLSDETLLAVLASPHLSGLRRLHVVCGRPTAASLVAACRLPALERLTFNSSIPQPLDPGGTRALARLSGLRSLELKGWHIADDAARALWAGSYPALRALTLRDCGIGPGGLEGLGDGGCLPALELLDLRQNVLADGGAEALARATRWTRLRWLQLSRNVIGARGAAALAGASHLTSLETLVLHWNAIPDEGAAAFARGRPPALRKLDLSHNLIGDVGMRTLAEAGVRPLCQGNPASAALIKASESGKAPPPEKTPAAPREAARVEAVGPRDEDGLVRAILADPWDDLARSAYADWLEEQGKPLHAELLRLPRTEEARRRHIVTQLSQAAYDAMDCDGGGIPAPGEDGLLEVRSMLISFIGRKSQLRLTSSLREHHIERVILEGRLTDWSRLADAEVMTHLRALDLGPTGLRDDGAKVLARCEGMGRLCALSLQHAQLTPRGLATLCGSEHLGRLVALAPPDLAVSSSSVSALADGPLAGGLRRLDLSGARLGDLDLGVILHSRTLSSALVSLDLSLCELSDRSAGALAASANMGALRSLDLSHNRFTEAGLALLASSGLFRRLRRLRMVSGPHLGSLTGFRPLLRAADVPGLTLVLSKPGDGSAVEFREALGARLILE